MQMPFFKSEVEIVVITWNILPLEAKFVKIEIMGSLNLLAHVY